MVTHPRPSVYVTPSGWRARCSACGWEQGNLADRLDASTAFLEHAENEHAIIIKDTAK